jgi:Xaa-Pro aminopeptidase
MLNGALILSQSGVKLVTTGLDYERAVEQASADEIIECGHNQGLYKILGKQCRKYKKIGVAKSRFTIEMADNIGLGKSRLADIDGLMKRERSVKEPREIDAIQRCSDICNRCVKFLESRLRAGLKESELGAELDSELKRKGSERQPFETIVSSGARSAFVHPYPPASGRRIGRGLGLVDFGAVYRGYANDITVPFVVGKADRKTDKMIETVFSVWDRVLKKIRHGAATKSLHDVYEKGLKDAGFAVKHSLGHGVGLDVHEYPSFGDRKVKLEQCMTIAVEPGVYVKKTGGCRFENTILVNKSGCDVLTKSKLIRV